MGNFVHEDEHEEPHFQAERLDELSMEEDRPEERSSGGRVRRFFNSRLFMVFLLLIFLSGLTWLAMHAQQWKQGVVVGKVVVNGATLLSRAEIEKSLSDFIGRNLESVDTSEVRKRLVGQPYIRDLRVSKELNGIIRVNISERRPLAVTVYQGQAMVIDTEGVLLPDNGISQRYTRLVTISGINRAVSAGSGMYRLGQEERQLVERLLEALQASEYAGIMVREIHLASGNMTSLSVAGSPIRFIVGNEGNFKEKLNKFEIFWQKVIAKKGFECYESVDLRYQDRVFAKGLEVTGTQQDSARGTLRNKQ